MKTGFFKMASARHIGIKLGGDLIRLCVFRDLLVLRPLAPYPRSVSAGSASLAARRL